MAINGDRGQSMTGKCAGKSITARRTRQAIPAVEDYEKRPLSPFGETLSESPTFCAPSPPLLERGIAPI